MVVVVVFVVRLCGIGPPSSKGVTGSGLLIEGPLLFSQTTLAVKVIAHINGHGSCWHCGLCCI